MDLLNNPALQASAIPFVVALLLGVALAATRYLALAVVSGLIAVLALTIGFTPVPFTAVSKLWLATFAAALTALVLEAAWRRCEPPRHRGRGRGRRTGRGVDAAARARKPGNRSRGVGPCGRRLRAHFRHHRQRDHRRRDIVAACGGDRRRPRLGQRRARLARRVGTAGPTRARARHRERRGGAGTAAARARSPAGLDPRHAVCHGRGNDRRTGRGNRRAALVLLDPAAVRSRWLRAWCPPAHRSGAGSWPLRPAWLRCCRWLSPWASHGGPRLRRPADRRSGTSRFAIGDFR